MFEPGWDLWKKLEQHDQKDVSCIFFNISLMDTYVLKREGEQGAIF